MDYAMRWNYIFWDWNGTIVDDLEYNYNIVNMLLEKYGLPLISIEDYRNEFCFPIRKFYTNIGFKCNDSEYAQIAMEYQTIYESRAKEIDISPIMVDLMSRLYSLGIKQIIFSSSDRRTLDLQLAYYPRLKPYINGIICQDNNLGIGKFELAQNWEKELGGVDWSSVVIIGDTYYERDIAKELGADCILINSGHQLIDRAATRFVFDNIEELSKESDIFR